MVFTLLVCSDVSNVKLNLEITFPHHPSLAELKSRITEVFAQEVLELQRTNQLPRDSDILDANTSLQLLATDRIQIYDDGLQRWVDLAASQQLHEYDQLYVFPRRRAHLDSRRDLPPPRAPSSSVRGPGLYAPGPGTAAGAGGSDRSQVFIPPPPQTRPTPARLDSPPRARSPGHHQVGPHISDSSLEARDIRVTTLFGYADVRNDGYVPPAGFRAMFRDVGISFSDVAIDQMFAFHSASGSFLTFAEFAEWAINYPTIFSATYSRLQNKNHIKSYEQELRSVERKCIALRARADELTLELEKVQRELRKEETAQRDIEKDLSRDAVHRQHLEDEEQVLLDKELRVQHQRKMLERDQRDLVETARRFDYRLAAGASPVAETGLMARRLERGERGDRGLLGSPAPTEWH